MRVIIVGCGPAGGYTGYLLAQQGHDVTIYEEHDTIGKPIQCTGILTKDILEFVPELESTDAVVNKIKHIILNSPCGKQVKVPSEEFIVCRTRFDQMIASKAQSAGAKIKTNCTFVEAQGSLLRFKDKNTNTFFEETADIVVGADGPRSKIAQHFFVGNAIPSYSGMQIVVRKDKSRIVKDTYDTYFGKEFPEFFGWDVPESTEHTRLGLATKQTVSKYYDAFCERVDVKKLDFGERQGGQIPIFNPKNKWYTKHEDMHVFLVGDAATQIKSTTGGGIIPSLKGASLLSHCIASKQFGKYKVSFFNSVSRELYMHLVVRLVLDTFSDADYEKLIGWCSSKSVLKKLKECSRDSALALIPSVLMAQPKLLYFAKNGIACTPKLFKHIF